MSVKDNGVGFNIEETGAGFGLYSMRRRAEEMGGTFSISNEEGMGINVRVTLPLDPRSQNYKHQSRQGG